MTATTTPPPASAASPSRLSGEAGGITLLVILFASFMDLLDATILTVAAPAIATDLQASQAQLQWMLASYVLALGSGLITGGRIGDDYGRRRVFLASLVAFAVASGVCALATSPEMLIATRVVQGLAGGLMVPQVFGIIRSSFDRAGMAKAFGAFGAVQGLAAVAGPLLGGFLVEADLFGLGWRTIFWVNVPFAAVAFVLGMRVLPESTSEHRAVLDVVGAALSSLAVFLVLLPLVQGRDWGWPWWGFGLMGAGALLMAGFLRYEGSLVRRGRQPVLDPALLRVRSFTAGLLASVFFFGAIGALFLTLSIYLQIGTGRTAWQTGLVILPYAIGSILTSGVGIALAARAGRALLVSGSLILATSQVLLWYLVRDGQDPGYWMLATAMFVGGLGLGLAAPILVNVVLAGIPSQDAGAAGGVLSTAIQIGAAAGIAVLGTIFFAALDNPGAGSSRLGVFGDAFAAVILVEIGLYVLAAMLMLLLPKAAAAEPGEDPSTADVPGNETGAPA
ncbi:MFS transporter [Aeromicrobium sp.]|uniref:MFS transporter n=1 Tax=Aeromicrobium sp. TaxID=1871063 RepID=UPI0019B427A4|nr:MFS transporter [Aeromicrobium sp.]MBC7631053.1 MFS transporter [Aeromicrobium sp.]